MLPLDCLMVASIDDESTAMRCVIVVSVEPEICLIVKSIDDDTEFKLFSPVVSLIANELDTCFIVKSTDPDRAVTR